MRKILVDAYLALNLGDDLFLKILFEKYPKVKFEMINVNAQYKDIFAVYENVKIIEDKMYKFKVKLWTSYLAKDYDALIFIGGSIFIQFDQWEKQYNFRKKIINAFYKQNKKIFILGSNFGPYDDKNFVKKYEDLFKKCTDICFRDYYSYNLFLHLENVRLEPDIVFQYSHENNKKIKNSIGFSVISLDDREDLVIHKKEYISKLKELTLEAVKRGKTVYFFSFCEHQGDLLMINEILDGLNLLGKVESINYTGDINKFISKFSMMESIIGVRFHACILSQVFNQGLFPIIYSDKTYNVLSDINLVEMYKYISDIKNLDVNYVLDNIDGNMLKKREVLTHSVNQFKGFEEYVEKL